MKTLCFAQMKGGTGKTTISYNIACILAEHAKVLVVDFDPQCNLSSNFCFDVFDEDAKTVADMLDNIKIDPLDMKKNENFFNSYDYVIFDTAPSMGIINQNAFFVADHIILVTDPDCNSARMAHVFLKLWDEAREYSLIPNTVDALIINNVERTKISNKMLDFIDSHPVLSKIKLETTVPHTTRFKECVEQNKPIQFLITKSKTEEKSREKAENSIRKVIEELYKRGIL